MIIYNYGCEEEAVPRIITDWTKSQFGQLEFFPGGKLSDIINSPSIQSVDALVSEFATGAS